MGQDEPSGFYLSSRLLDREQKATSLTEGSSAPSGNVGRRVFRVVKELKMVIPGMDDEGRSTNRHHQLFCGVLGTRRPSLRSPQPWQAWGSQTGTSWPRSSSMRGSGPPR